MYCLKILDHVQNEGVFSFRSTFQTLHPSSSSYQAGENCQRITILDFGTWNLKLEIYFCFRSTSLTLHPSSSSGQAGEKRQRTNLLFTFHFFFSLFTFIFSLLSFHFYLFTFIFSLLSSNFYLLTFIF